MSRNEVGRALEVFARGFAFIRSFTHPYLVDRVGPLLVLRDAPRKRGPYRNEEWIAYGTDPEEVHAVVAEHARGRFSLCAIADDTEDEAELRDRYKAIGYRLGRTEPLMVHRLARIARPRRSVSIERVLTEAGAVELAKATRSRPIPGEHLRKDAPIRQYVAREGGALSGWVTSIQSGDATYCSNMYVAPEHRRRGVATALMARLLRDDRAAGSKLAVLLASHTGALLYPHLGYEQIGTLLLLQPRRTAK